MKDHLISIFIDDELTLDEKIAFVQAVCDRPGFKDAALTLIEQERCLRSEVVTAAPMPQVETARRWSGFRLRAFMNPLLAAAFAGIVAAASFLYFDRAPDPQKVSHRFVVYQPEAEQVAIAGSFTRWEPMPLQRTGSSGYWELTLELPAGEHRFSYLLDGGTVFADPTLPSREKDDFGGENSVLRVSAG
ncbi:MAG TPA: glycogen-binding domain-containing protein [Desulfobacterales bacterium]